MNFDQFRIVAITISLSTLVHGQLVILNLIPTSF